MWLGIVIVMKRYVRNMNVNLPNTEGIDYTEVGIRYSDGSVVYKAVPDDSTSEDQEEHVLDLFVKCYADLKSGTEKPITYTITGRDDGINQQHDFSVDVPVLGERMDIEITMIGEEQGTHISHRLRRVAFAENDKYRQDFFAFLPPTTNPRDIESLFQQAANLPPEDFPDINASDLNRLIERLKIVGTPYVRINSKGVRQVHTVGETRRPLREIVHEAIKKKEDKTYPGIDQSEMVLVLDDQLLGYDRTYLESVQALLAYEHSNSTFKEIFIISRKTSPSKEKDAVHEVMISPLKAPWYRPLYEAKVFLIKLLNQGETLPLSY